MGQHMASNVLNWLDVKKLVLSDVTDTILVGRNRTKLTDFAASFSASRKDNVDVIAEITDVTSEEEVGRPLQRHGKIDYLMLTVGIAPSPVTPPEQLTKEAITGAYEVNLWGTHNIIKQGVNSGTLRDARGDHALNLGNYGRGGPIKRGL